MSTTILSTAPNSALCQSVWPCKKVLFTACPQMMIQKFNDVSMLRQKQLQPRGKWDYLVLRYITCLACQQTKWSNLIQK